MISIIVVFPKQEEANSIRRLLIRNGFDVVAACTTGTQVIKLLDDLDYGIVVSGYKFVDMMYDELLECLPDSFQMLLVASQSNYAESTQDNLLCLSMPIKVADLVDTVRLMYDKLSYQYKRRRAKPLVRSEEDRKVITEAKLLLMQKKQMTEEEAHRYIQKQSMDNGTNMVETSHMILKVFI